MLDNIAPFLSLGAAVLALLFAVYRFYSVKAKPEGTEQMRLISSKIRKGAMAYLKRQYRTVGVFFVIMFIVE